MASTIADTLRPSDPNVATATKTEAGPSAAAPTTQTNLPPPPDPPERERRPLTRQAVFEIFALYGLAGDIVRTIAPHTEAQPEALLLQLLAAFANIIGPGPHCMVGATRHSLNLFVVLVGESSKARKGTSWNQIAHLFAAVDPAWAGNRVISERVTLRTLTALLGPEQTGDRRLLVLAQELASMLHTMGRSRSPISPLLRSAWDSGTLRVLDSDHSGLASRGHLSLVGHITQRELETSLHRTDIHNGFANRCLWAYVKRSQCLPDGGNVPPEEVAAIAQELKHVVEWTATEPERLLRRDEEAAEFWNNQYAYLSQATEGIREAATGRAEAQVLRISAIYALLDCSPVIRLPHLMAALAVWDYCSDSARQLFGTCVGDPITDRIHEALQSSRDGISRKQIRVLFNGHVSSSAIQESLEKLEKLGVIRSRSVSGRGRPTTLWCSIDPTAPDEEEDDQDDEPYLHPVLKSILGDIF